MKALIRVTALTLLLLPVILSAQEPQHPLAGYWRGPMVEGAGEDGEVTIELRIQGEVVTGPISTSKIGDLSIRNGTVSGNTIHFTSPGLDPGTPGVSLVWTGQLSGNNELAVSVIVEGGDGTAQEFVLTKRTPIPGGRH